jgi:riboflavin kinase / FMN adenylyltransferase
MKKVINSLKELEHLSGLAVTIGNFDGVHLGHHQMIQDIKEECLRDGLSLVVVSFEPHPLEILTSKKNFILSNVTEKTDLLFNAGADFVWIMNFDEYLSNLHAVDFLSRYLTQKNLKRVFMGYDFKFGKGKTGSIDSAAMYYSGEVEVSQMIPNSIEGEVVSSSLIRNLVENGEIELIPKYLGRCFSLSAPVVHGEQRGRKLGFPTCNLSISDRYILPANGVYVTDVEVMGKTYNGVTNVGIAPTFERGDKKIETHIIDFDRQVYGEVLTIKFLKKLREEKRFNSFDDLRVQIGKDIADARKYYEDNQSCLNR